MKIFGTNNFLSISIFFATLLLTTVLVQQVLQRQIDEKAKVMQALIHFNSQVEEKLANLDLSNFAEATHKSASTDNPLVAKLIHDLQKYMSNNTITFLSEEIVIPEDLISRIDSDLSMERPTHELLAELLYKLNQHHSTANATVAQLGMIINETQELLKAYLFSLHYYQGICAVALFFLLALELVFFIRFLRNSLFNRIIDCIQYSESLSGGKCNVHKMSQVEGQIGLLVDRLNLINESMGNAIQFIQDLTSGKSDMEFAKQSIDDELFKSINELALQIDNNRKREEQINWMNVGIAKFGEILQHQNRDLKDFGDQIISELVKYTEANQGAIFCMQDSNEGKCLNVLSTYAWGKKRFVENSYNLDDGNLMAQAIKEGEFIHLKEIPDDFINITSGLGDANPRAILIVPLITNNETMGVIELATFTEFEDHKIELITKICENVSASFSAIANATNTKNLLMTSQALTEQLRSQEEELRQNTEELEASRENLHRELEIAKDEMRQQVENIEEEKLKNIAILEGCVDGVIIFKESGKVEFFNKSAEEIWGFTRKEINGNSIDRLLPIEIHREGGEKVLYFKGNGQFKKIDVRTEITTYNKFGEEISLLVTVSKGSVKGNQTYAFFVQTITVELF